MTIRWRGFRVACLSYEFQQAVRRGLMRGRSMSFALWLLLTIVVVISISGVIGAFGGQAVILRLLDRLDQIGAWAALLFILMDMLVVIFVLPGVILTMAAGFLFGVMKGSLYVVIATTTGASIAFFISRHLLGERAVGYLRAHPRLNRIEQDLTHQGWKLVSLTRLIPFFPFKLSNYFFGVTRLSFFEFYMGNLVGIVPFTMTNVYLGSIAADLATLGAGRAARSWQDWLVYSVGFVMTVAALVYLVRLAQKTLGTGSPKRGDGSPN